MQDETAVGVHRTAGVDWQLAAALVRLGFRLQLLEHVGQTEAAAAVDHQAHGAVLVVLDQIDHRVGEIGVGHVRHGDQEMMLEIAGGCAFHEP
ncbi:hypothetical protein D3C86_1777900 [compost metagenome]